MVGIEVGIGVGTLVSVWVGIGVGIGVGTLVSVWVGIGVGTLVGIGVSVMLVANNGVIKIENKKSRIISG